MGIFRRFRRLWDTYRVPGFRPLPTIIGVFGDPKARVIALVRRSKKRVAARAAEYSADGTTARRSGSATSPTGTLAFTWMWRSAVSSVDGAAR